MSLFLDFGETDQSNPDFNGNNFILFFDFYHVNEIPKDFADAAIISKILLSGTC